MLLHLVILWVASSELLHWTDIYESVANYKLGLTILWGGYAILLVVLGILKEEIPANIGYYTGRFYAVEVILLRYYPPRHSS